jgi:hypothetical protein
MRRFSTFPRPPHGDRGSGLARGQKQSQAVIVGRVSLEAAPSSACHDHAEAVSFLVNNRKRIAMRREAAEEASVVSGAAASVVLAEAWSHTFPLWRVLRSKPTTGIAGCCACAESGQAAAPPSSDMNWRRLWSSMGSSPEPAVPPYRSPRMPRKRPAGPWGKLNSSESGWDQSVPSSPIALEINDSTSRFCGESSRQPATHHRAESHGHADEREAIESIC